MKDIVKIKLRLLFSTLYRTLLSFSKDTQKEYFVEVSKN